MNEYSLGQTVYFIEYFGPLENKPAVVSFLIAAIRQTESGYMYSKFEDPASPYTAESELFETIEDAVNYQIALLQELIPE